MPKKAPDKINVPPAQRPVARQLIRNMIDKTIELWRLQSEFEGVAGVAVREFGATIDEIAAGSDTGSSLTNEQVDKIIDGLAVDQ